MSRISEQEAELEFITGFDDCHDHPTVTLDVSGNGVTANKLTCKKEDHVHKVVGWKVIKAGGHTHKLLWADTKKPVKIDNDGQPIRANQKKESRMKKIQSKLRELKESVLGEEASPLMEDLRVEFGPQQSMSQGDAQRMSRLVGGRFKRMGRDVERDVDFAIINTMQTAEYAEKAFEPEFGSHGFSVISESKSIQEANMPKAAKEAVQNFETVRAEIQSLVLELDNIRVGSEDRAVAKEADSLMDELEELNDGELDKLSKRLKKFAKMVK